MPRKMTREQVQRIGGMIQEMIDDDRREDFDLLYVDSSGDAQMLSRDDPGFFADAMYREPTAFANPPKDGADHPRHNIPAAVRREVLQRDGCRCYLCGDTVLMDGLHFDHIIPVARGGANTADNIGVACAVCNLAKNDKLTDKRPAALQ